LHAAQVNAFLQFFYGTLPNMLAADKIATVTIGFWTNSTGWPVKVSTTDQSAIVHLAIGETLTYNQRMSITAP
jgi:hypothetical protein